MEKCAYFNEEPGRKGELSVRFDVVTGRIWACGAGFWSLPQSIVFFDQWRQIIRRIHRAGQPVSALVDMSGSDIQSAEVTDIVAGAAAGLYADGDAIAMLVPTFLAKLQMRRVLDARFHGFFTARDEAEAWLRARSIHREHRQLVR